MIKPPPINIEHKIKIDVALFSIMLASNFVVKNTSIGIEIMAIIKNLFDPVKIPTAVSKMKIDIQRMFEENAELFRHNEKERNEQIKSVKLKKLSSPTNAVPLG